MAPFDQEALKAAFARGPDAEYGFGGNMFWQDFLWSPTPAVPINGTQVKELMNVFFPPLNPPAKCPMEIVLAIEDVREASNNRGALQRVSAEEPVHACLFAIHSALDQGASDAVLQRWKALLLSCPMRFWKLGPGEPRYWKAQQLREDIVESFATLRRSDLQKIFDVARFKQTLESETGESLSAEKLAQKYQKNVKTSCVSEPLSKSFIDSACTVYRRLLNNPAICKALLDLDATHLKGNPLGSVWKLQALIDRAKTDSNIEVAMELLLDHYNMKYIDKSDFAMPKFKEQNRSYVEVVLLKKEIIKLLMTEFLDKHNFESKVKAKFREVFGDVKKVRAMLTPYPENNNAVDTTWQASWPSSGVKLFDLAEAISMPYA